MDPWGRAQEFSDETLLVPGLEISFVIICHRMWQNLCEDKNEEFGSNFVRIGDFKTT